MVDQGGTLGSLFLTRHPQVPIPLTLLTPQGLHFPECLGLIPDSEPGTPWVPERGNSQAPMLKFKQCHWEAVLSGKQKGAMMVAAVPLCPSSSGAPGGSPGFSLP